MLNDFSKIVGFLWTATTINKQGEILDQWSKFNKIPEQGLSFLLRSPFGDVPTISNFYCGLFKGSYIPSEATTANDIPTIGEYVNYQEATRPSWNRSYDGKSTMTNTANKAVFTFTEDQTLNGFFLVSSNIKGSGNGTLLSIVRFATPKSITQGVELKLTASLAYLSGTTL